MREGLPAAAPNMPVCQWGYILAAGSVRKVMGGSGVRLQCWLADVITEVAGSICLLMLAMTCCGWHGRHGNMGKWGLLLTADGGLAPSLTAAVDL